MYTDTFARPMQRTTSSFMHPPSALKKSRIFCVGPTYRFRVDFACTTFSTYYSTIYTIGLH
jgi:hypothetical protein